MVTKICLKCSQEKNISDFVPYKNRKGNVLYRNTCKVCSNKYNNQYYIENKQYFDEHNKKYWIEHRDDLIENNKLWKQNNKDIVSISTEQYKIKNKDIMKEKRSRRAKKLRKEDPVFRLKELLSSTIRAQFKKIGSSKNTESIKKYLPYTLEDLKNHLEAQFESWMTWDNQGKYIKKEWRDNDQSTWKWQIDHIIPHSEFKYTLMQDQSFQNCWALSNLRPLSAKQNLLDGASKSRHKKEKI